MCSAGISGNSSKILSALIPINLGAIEVEINTSVNLDNLRTNSFAPLITGCVLKKSGSSKNSKITSARVPSFPQ